MNRKRLIPFLIAVLALFVIVISKIVEIGEGEKEFIIAWTASGLIAISALFIRYYSVDLEGFSEIIKGTNPDPEKELNPKRYLDFMTLAFLIGFVATVVIHYNFIAGMLVYLLMQISIIIGFSGLFDLNVIRILRGNAFPKLKQIASFSLVFWILLISTVYLYFVYSGSDSLIVIPYVIALGTMAHYTWYGLAYTNRSALFRYMFPIASAIFVFSDALIGNNVYGIDKLPDDVYLLIDLTYVINLFFMSQAVLFLTNSTGQAPFKG